MRETRPKNQGSVVVPSCDTVCLLCIPQLHSRNLLFKLLASTEGEKKLRKNCLPKNLLLSLRDRNCDYHNLIGRAQHLYMDLT